MRLIIIIAAAVVALGIAGGGALYYFEFSSPAGAAPKAASVPAKPFFVSLKSMVVALPDKPSEGKLAMVPDTTYLQVGFEFATGDEKAVQAFKDMRPAIRGNVLDLMLNQSADIISDQQKRRAMKAAVLKAVNQTIANGHSDEAKPPSFGKIYISRFVTQAG